MTMEFMRDLWNTAKGQFSFQDREDMVPNPAKTSLDEVVEQAHRDWVDAKAFFDNVIDPELVDYAVYSMEAAERKYVYLLNKARSAHRLR
ncbi:MAG: DUF2508 family protein [Firmicutes bacterium]|nr:DUF2508 family protein [Bacillota bacterium]